MKDETEFERCERVFGADMRAAEKVARLLNPELLMNDRHVSAAIVDLRRRYDIVPRKLPTLFRDEQWEAIDRVTFDHDPEGRWHIVGRGPSSTEAVRDLLGQLADEFAKGE